MLYKEVTLLVPDDLRTAFEVGRPWAETRAVFVSREAAEDYLDYLATIGEADGLEVSSSTLVTSARANPPAGSWEAYEMTPAGMAEGEEIEAIQRDAERTMYERYEFAPVELGLDEDEYFRRLRSDDWVD